VGAALHFESDLSAEFLLFHEGPSRILVSTANADAVVEIAVRHGVAAGRVGITMNGGLAIGNRGEVLVSVPVDSLKAVYEESLEKQLRS
jgi:phosphoribosylformylglycinamidine synthase